MIIYNNFLEFFNFLKKKKIINNFYNNFFIILKVLQIKKKYVILDGNLKSECFIKIEEFLENGNLEIKKGDYIEVFLKNFENNYNKIIISRSKIKSYFFWKNLAIIYNNKIFVKANISNKIKGGYSVIMNGFKCFLPFSCSDKRVSNIDYYFDKNLYFSVLNFDFLKKNIILSRKVVIHEISKVKRKIFFKNIKRGVLVKGVIRVITNYCLFVDIGYLDCVIFFKDLIWGNYRYLNDFLKIGKSILGIVLKIDKKKKRVFLGVKQIFNPWKKIEFLINSIKYVRILRLSTNNIYVILSKNIMASIYNRFNKNIFYLIRVGEYKKIKILNFNFKRKRINFKILP